MSHRCLRRISGAPVIVVTIIMLLAAACRTTAPRPPDEQASALRILVSTDGVYRITTGELQQVGFPTEPFDHEHLRLSSDGDPVPFLVNAEGLIFYGQGTDSRYTRYRPYILEHGLSGVPFETLSAPQTEGPQIEQIERTLHLEENRDYVSDAVIQEGVEPWFWQTIQLQSSATIEFELPAVSDGGGEAHLQLYGTTHNPRVDPDHSLGFSINGYDGPSITWDGQIIHNRVIPLAAGTLQNGGNAITLENLPEEYLDLMRLDWITIRYNSEPVAVDDHVAFTGVEGNLILRGFSSEPTIIEVSTPNSPRLLTEWAYDQDGIRLGVTNEMEIIAVGPDGYLSPAAITPLRHQPGWEEAEQQADLIIITTDQLAPALQPLVEARQEHGLSVSVIPVEEIYDTFGFGWQTPDSITAFLAHALEHWAQPAPAYLLLVGDATTDYRGYLAERPEHPTPLPQNVIPPALVPVRFGGETISDARLADADGDGKPDLAVGRWPADTVQEVERLVERTLAYESGTATNQTLFAADGTSTEFIRLAERVLEKAQIPTTASTLMNGPTSAEFTAAWNEGAWLVTYAGHGSLELWGRDDVFSSSAVPALNPSGNVPIVVQLTCLSGLFAHPETQSLSETLLLDDDGPVLLVGATSLTLSAHQEPFAVALLQRLQDPSVERVGDALWQAKQELDVSNSGLQEISDTFGLLGDPSTMIVRP